MLLVASIFRHGPVLGVYPSAARLFIFTKHVETFTPPYEYGRVRCFDKKEGTPGFAQYAEPLFQLKHFADALFMPAIMLCYTYQIILRGVFPSLQIWLLTCVAAMFWLIDVQRLKPRTFGYHGRELISVYSMGMTSGG